MLGSCLRAAHTARLVPHVEAAEGSGRGERRRRRAAWVRMPCGRAAVPPLARERGKQGDGGGRRWKRCLRQLRKGPLIFQMGAAGSPPARVAAGCQSAWEGSEVTGSVQDADLPRRGERRHQQPSGFWSSGVPDHYVHSWVRPEHLTAI